MFIWISNSSGKSCHQFKQKTTLHLSDLEHIRECFSKKSDFSFSRTFCSKYDLSHSVLGVLHRRCIRVMLGMIYVDDCRGSFKHLSIPTFRCVYIFHCFLYLKHNIHHFKTHADIHNYPTRNQTNIVPDFHRLAKTRDGTYYYSVIFYNAMPDRVRSMNDRVFRPRLMNY